MARPPHPAISSFGGDLIRWVHPRRINGYMATDVPPRPRHLVHHHRQATEARMDERVGKPIDVAYNGIIRFLLYLMVKAIGGL